MMPPIECPLCGEKVPHGCSLPCKHSDDEWERRREDAWKPEGNRADRRRREKLEKRATP